MEKQKHTPGPWKVERFEHEDTSKNLIQCEGTRCIASVDNSDDEDCANAALIAAGPDLLEACKALCSEMLKVCQEANSFTITKGMEMGSHAIAKAQGEIL